MLVHKQTLNLANNFVTEGGYVLKKPVVAYEDYGVKSGPVIFFAHGGLSNQHAAGKYSEDDNVPGYWDEIIGDGKVIDTRRFRVLSTNALGSMFGTTGPLTINPDTGEKYGPDFPPITMVDMVKFQKAFLDELGITELYMMCGVSMGSMHTLQMGALYPEFVKGLFPVATAGRMTAEGMCMHHLIIHLLRSDPEFNGGRYQDGTAKLNLGLVHAVMRIYYTNERIIRKLCWEPVADNAADAQQKRAELCRQYIVGGNDSWDGSRDPNSYISVVDAINTFDLGQGATNYEDGVRRIKCPIYLVNITTDSEFPPHCAAELADILNAVRPGQAEVAIVDSNWGHLGCIHETKQIAYHLQKFINRLDNCKR